jgi:hypothetical protein
MPDDLTFFEDRSTPGNVVAVGPVRSDGRVEGYCATYDRENSPVSWNQIPRDSLGDRLTEAEAREKHPRLFEKID